MGAMTYTLLDAVRIIGFRDGALKQKIETLANADVAVENVVHTVNQVILDIHKVRGLPAQNARDSIHTVAPYITGTVAVTNGSADVVGTLTVWTEAMEGRAFALNSKGIVYRVETIQDATNLTLDKAWVDDTASGESYRIAQDRYNLPADFFDFIGKPALEGTSTRTLDLKMPSEVDSHRYSTRMKPLEIGTPTMLTVFDIGATGTWQAELDLFPDEAYRITFRYKKVAGRLLNDHDIVPLPDEDFFLLVDGANALWKDVQDGKGMHARYGQWIMNDLAMSAAFARRSTDEVPRIVPADVMRQQRPTPSLLDLSST